MTQQPVEQKPSQGNSSNTIVYCAAHPQVETPLRCGKCDKPICPKCMVQTPVGARCAECAQLRRSPIYEVSPVQYLVAMGVAWGLGAMLGFVWAFLRFLPFFFYLNFMVSLGIGYAIGELTGRAINRKRGVGLQFVAAAGVLISFIVAQIRFLPGGVFFFPVVALFNPWSLLALALGVYMAVNRLR